MIANDANVEAVRAWCAPYGIEVSADAVGLMLRHLDLVVATNEKFNLTRIVDEHDALVRHVVDSLLFVPAIERGGDVAGKRFVDVGTGAGFPGVPLAAATDMDGVLIDSVGKKVTAVEGFLRELGLNERVVARKIRAEELAVVEARTFDFVTARAVADLGVLVEYASPLLKMGGKLVVSKGQIGDDELERGRMTENLAGMHEVSRETYELPEGAGHRELITYVREGKCKVKLPRQVGMAKHKPLWERV